VERVVLLFCQIDTCALQGSDAGRECEDDGCAFLLIPADVVSVRLGVGNDWIVTGSVDAANFCGGVDGRLAQFLLRELDENLVEVGVVDIVQADKGREDVRGKVLQDIELSRVSACMHNPCKAKCGGGYMTYSWNNVYVSISVQSDRIDEQDRESGEVVVAEPCCTGHGELFWHAILLSR
jgi:hypothetical protein